MNGPYYLGAWDPDYLATHPVLCAAEAGSHIETQERVDELNARHASQRAKVDA